MSSAYEDYPWEPRPGEPQCSALSGTYCCQLPAEHAGPHFYDLGSMTFSWPNNEHVMESKR